MKGRALRDFRCSGAPELRESIWSLTLSISSSQHCPHEDSKAVKTQSGGLEGLGQTFFPLSYPLEGPE